MAERAAGVEGMRTTGGVTCWGARSHLPAGSIPSSPAACSAVRVACAARTAVGPAVRPARMTEQAAGEEARPTAASYVLGVSTRHPAPCPPPVPNFSASATGLTAPTNCSPSLATGQSDPLSSMATRSPPRRLVPMHGDSLASTATRSRPRVVRPGRLARDQDDSLATRTTRSRPGRLARDHAQSLATTTTLQSDPVTHWRTRDLGGGHDNSTAATTTRPRTRQLDRGHDNSTTCTGPRRLAAVDEDPQLDTATDWRTRDDTLEDTRQLVRALENSTADTRSRQRTQELDRGPQRPAAVHDDCHWFTRVRCCGRGPTGAHSVPDMTTRGDDSLPSTAACSGPRLVGSQRLARPRPLTRSRTRPLAVDHDDDDVLSSPRPTPRLAGGPKNSLADTTTTCSRPRPLALDHDHLLSITTTRARPRPLAPDHDHSRPTRPRRCALVDGDVLSSPRLQSDPATQTAPRPLAVGTWPWQQDDSLFSTLSCWRLRAWPAV
ncbi:hypothetical protein C8Q76DRAFT_695020 [Earliella scabrosa]|nr:hypothetical protein C8Q76DRAFT_695020 [Earliella scabrosa]